MSIIALGRRSTGLCIFVPQQPVCVRVHTATAILWAVGRYLYPTHASQQAAPAGKNLRGPRRRKQQAQRLIRSSLPFADISELNLGRNDTILFPEGQDKLLHFQITMRPKEGIYRRAALRSRPRTNGDRTLMRQPSAPAAGM